MAMTINLAISRINLKRSSTLRIRYCSDKFEEHLVNCFKFKILDHFLLLFFTLDEKIRLFDGLFHEYGNQFQDR